MLQIKSHWRYYFSIRECIGEPKQFPVLDASFNIIWFEEITPDSMDSYSVLVIADGDGWDAGEYTIMASYGADSDTVKITVQ